MKNSALEQYMADHEYVDMDGAHWHLMVTDRQGKNICIDIMRTEAGEVFAGGWYGNGSGQIETTLQKQEAAL